MSSLFSKTHQHPLALFIGLFVCQLGCGARIAKEGDGEIAKGSIEDSAEVHVDGTVAEAATDGAAETEADGTLEATDKDIAEAGTSIVDDSIGASDEMTCVIATSSYDQSCSQDSDCVAVAQGNFCIHGCTNCLNAAINIGAQEQYAMDFSNKFPISKPCPCSGPTHPTCQHSICTLDE
jgi:hypothetical protein